MSILQQPATYFIIGVILLWILYYRQSRPKASLIEFKPNIHYRGSVRDIKITQIRLISPSKIMYLTLNRPLELDKDNPYDVYDEWNFTYNSVKREDVNDLSMANKHSLINALTIKVGVGADKVLLVDVDAKESDYIVDKVLLTGNSQHYPSVNKIQITNTTRNAVYTTTQTL